MVQALLSVLLLLNCCHTLWRLVRQRVPSGFLACLVLAPVVVRSLAARVASLVAACRNMVVVLVSAGLS